jgi:hypothetical protein
MTTQQDSIPATAIMSRIMSRQTSLTVWLLFHRKEPHYCYGFGNVCCQPGRPRGPSYYDMECVGVYSTEEAADRAAQDYFSDDLGLEEDEDLGDNEDCSDLGGLFP